MKRTGLLAISIGLNLALLAVVVSQRSTLARLGQTPGPTQAAAKQPRLPAKEPRATTPTTAAPVLPTFNWQSVESEDYKIYIQQLRAIGCPEDTIRDIIIADVRKLFDQKRTAVVPKEPPKYWQAKYSAPLLTVTQEQQLRAVDEEEKKILRELLGPDWKKPSALDLVREQEGELQLDGLSAETREKIRAWTSKYAGLESDLFASLGGGRMTRADEAKREALHRQKGQELAALLTPVELEQFQVRNSDTAEQLRAATVGVELTEDEFLKIFRLRKSLEDQTSDSSSGKKAALAERQVEEQIKQLLGEPRYTELQRSSDSDYRDLSQLAKRFELPPTVTTKVYDLQKTTDAQRLRIEVDPNLSEAAREAALAELQRRADSTIKGLIGDKAFKAYQQVFGDEPDP